MFPNSLSTFTPFSTPITLQALGHTARHASYEAEIAAIAAKVGINSSAVTTSHDYKLSAVTGSNKAETNASKDTDVTLAANSDTKYPSQKAIKAYVDALKSILYPIGSIYTNASDATNPATLFGFGTWTAFGTGRVLVSIDGSQTEFDSIGETGGEKTHVLTTAEMPAHTHSYDTNTSNGTSTVGVFQGGDLLASTTGSTGGGGAHNNLQPYVVVYMWKRTA